MNQVEKIEADLVKSTENGINHKSLLAELQYFGMCKGELAPDIMHDLLEGVLQYEIKLLLIYCININNHFFMLDILNSKIESLEVCYGMESDRPTPIDTLRSIKAWDLNFSLISLYQLITANYMIINIINA